MTRLPSLTGKQLMGALGPGISRAFTSGDTPGGLP